MNLYNVFDIKENKQILHNVHRKTVLKTLGIVSSHLYKTIDLDTLYKNRYHIVPVEEETEKATLIEWDRYCNKMRNQVNRKVLRKITFYGVNEKGEVIR
ncbi:MAG: hypothetical protein WCD89_10570 [Anaerocolumna sp.]